MKLENKVYDILKKIATLYLPATIVLVTAILKACGVDPDTITLVSQILVAVDTFLGSILEISTYSYNKAQNIEEDKKDEDIH